MEHKIALKSGGTLELWAYSSKRESYQFMNLSMSDRTECIGEPSVEGTPSPLVIWVVLHEEVDFAVLSFWHHVLFQIGLQFSVGPSRPISPVRESISTSVVVTYVMFIVETENKVPSSSQLPDMRISLMSKTG